MDDERKVLKSYYDHFEAYITLKTNIFAHYESHEKVQGISKPLEQFVKYSRLLVKDCNFANSEEMIRDCVVFGISFTKSEREATQRWFRPSFG